MSVTALKSLWASAALHNSSYTSHINTLEIIHLRSELTTQESFSLTRDLLPLPLIRKRPGLLHRQTYSKDSLVPRLSPKASPHGGEPGNEATVNTTVAWLHQTNFKARMNFASLPSYRTMTYHLLDLSPTSANRQTPLKYRTTQTPPSYAAIAGTMNSPVT